MGAKLLSLKRIDVLGWFNTIWDEFRVEIVKNSITGCGHVLKKEETTKRKQNLREQN